MQQLRHLPLVGLMLCTILQNAHVEGRTDQTAAAPAAQPTVSTDAPLAPALSPADILSPLWSNSSFHGAAHVTADLYGRLADGAHAGVSYYQIALAHLSTAISQAGNLTAAQSAIFQAVRYTAFGVHGAATLAPKLVGGRQTLLKNLELALLLYEFFNADQPAYLTVPQARAKNLAFDTAILNLTDNPSDPQARQAVANYLHKQK